MAVCKECKWYKVHHGNPMKGECLVERSEEEVTRKGSEGRSLRAVREKLVSGDQPACEKFEERKSRQDLLEVTY
jgi:hypothetical protein